MARNSGPYAKQRRKVVKPKDQKSPFKKELDNRRNKKIIFVVVAIIIIAMVSTLIIPYLSGSATKNWSLPDTVLKADETPTDNTFTAQNILVGETFNRPEKEYYVLFGTAEKMSEVESDLVRTTYYKVDSSLFENNVLTKDVDKGSDLPKKPSDIKVKDKVALLQVKDGKAVKFVSGTDDVKLLAKKLNK